MMLSQIQCQEYYQALLEKNPSYEGLFFVGVATTGIFCRPTCSARKPKFENCTFFKTAKEAVLASFRPCLRCRPLSHPGHMSETVRLLLAAVEADPARRWTSSDFDALSIDASTAKRHFQKRFGLTFVAYARARRMGLALHEIRRGASVINAQLDAGYESSSGFRDAFARIMGAAPTKSVDHLKMLLSAWIDTRLGPMVAIADEAGLYLLEFVERRGLEREVERLRTNLKAAIIPGENAHTQMIRTELDAYFNGTLTRFQTPTHLLGSPFQRRVWDALTRIPYGETRSYSEQAQALGEPTATRAVARANGANQLALIIPCHRVITKHGDIGGYGGGVPRKVWLLEHEKAFSRAQENRSLL